VKPGASVDKDAISVPDLCAGLCLLCLAALLHDSQQISAEYFPQMLLIA